MHEIFDMFSLQEWKVSNKMHCNTYFLKPKRWYVTSSLIYAFWGWLQFSHTTVYFFLPSSFIIYGFQLEIHQYPVPPLRSSCWPASLLPYWPLPPATLSQAFAEKLYSWTLLPTACFVPYPDGLLPPVPEFSIQNYSAQYTSFCLSMCAIIVGLECISKWWVFFLSCNRSLPIFSITCIYARCAQDARYSGDVHFYYDTLSHFEIPSFFPWFPWRH